MLRLLGKRRWWTSGLVHTSSNGTSGARRCREGDSSPTGSVIPIPLGVWSDGSYPVGSCLDAVRAIREGRGKPEHSECRFGGEERYHFRLQPILTNRIHDGAVFPTHLMLTTVTEVHYW